MAELPKKIEIEMGIDKLREFMDEYGDKFHSFSVLDIQPGDTIVLSHPGVMTSQAIDNIRQKLPDNFGADIKCVILEEGMQIEGVLRRNYAIQENIDVRHSESKCSNCGDNRCVRRKQTPEGRTCSKWIP